jgi:homocitrate synthase NifV
VHLAKVCIVDTTLRDGEQSPGVAFSAKEKIKIAQYLDLLGVEQIELGIPAMGGIEVDAISSIASLDLKARLTTWNRLHLSDIRASLSCRVKNLHICAPVSDIQIEYKLNKSRLWVLDCLKRAIRYAKDYGCWISVGAEDASRADPEFLLEYALLAQEMGAERLRYADTVGVLEPFSTYRELSWLKDKLKIELEFHGHNDFGLATANTVAAVNAGVRFIDVTVNGLGERAGNADMEEVVAAIRMSCGIGMNWANDKMKALSSYVARASNRKMPKTFHDFRKSGITLYKYV